MPLIGLLIEQAEDCLNLLQNALKRCFRNCCKHHIIRQIVRILEVYSTYCGFMFVDLYYDSEGFCAAYTGTLCPVASTGCRLAYRLSIIIICCRQWIHILSLSLSFNFIGATDTDVSTIKCVPLEDLFRTKLRVKSTQVRSVKESDNTNL